MKTKFVIIILTLFALNLQAEDLTTLDGKKYTDAKVLAVEPDGIRISYSDGVRKLMFKDLPPEIGKKYNYDPAKADAFEAKKQSQLAANAKAIAYEKALKELTEWTPWTRIKVSQCLNDGILGIPIPTHDFTVVFVEGIKDCVDDDEIVIKAGYGGVYEYITTMGSKRTVRKLTVLDRK